MPPAHPKDRGRSMKKINRKNGDVVLENNQPPPPSSSNPIGVYNLRSTSTSTFEGESELKENAKTIQPSPAVVAAAAGVDEVEDKSNTNSQGSLGSWKYEANKPEFFEENGVKNPKIVLTGKGAAPESGTSADHTSSPFFVVREPAQNRPTAASSPSSSNNRSLASPANWPPPASSVLPAAPLQPATATPTDHFHSPISIKMVGDGSVNAQNRPNTAMVFSDKKNYSWPPPLPVPIISTSLATAAVTANQPHPTVGGADPLHGGTLNLGEDSVNTTPINLTSMPPTLATTIIRGSPPPEDMGKDVIGKNNNGNTIDDVDSHVVNNGSTKPVTTEDASNSLNYLATSPKSHEPKSFADIFKAAEEIRTKGKLRFIAPILSDLGTKHANIPDELLVKQNEKWLLTLVGCFVGKRPAFPFVKFHAFRLWKKYGLVNVILNDRGFFYFKFENELGMKKVLDMKPWLFNDIPVLLKQWELGIEFDRVRPSSIHLWVNFYDLTPIMWNYEVLSHIVSVLGFPVAIDRYTEEMCEKDSGRAVFARVLLRVDADQDLPPFVEARVLGKMAKFRVQYYWKPDRCPHCNVFGHKFIDCTDRPKSAEEMEEIAPTTNTSNVAGPSGTKQVPTDSIDEHDFIQPKRRKRRPKKAQNTGDIIIPKPKVKYVPKTTTNDPKGKGISSDSSPPVRSNLVEASVPPIQTDDISTPDSLSAAQHDQGSTRLGEAEEAESHTAGTDNNTNIDLDTVTNLEVTEEVEATIAMGDQVCVNLRGWEAQIEEAIRSDG